MRERREAQGLTQAQLAQATGLSVARISDWEQGRRGARIDRETVERLARALPGTCPDMLLIAAGHGYYVIETKWGHRRSFKDYIKTRDELAEDLREHLIRQYKFLRKIPSD